MQPSPLVTIAVPTRNRAHYLALTLESALAQDHRPIEVVVSDNASTDGTAALLESVTDERVRVLRQERDLGLAGNWNACLQAARGEWLLLLSDDDLIDPDFVSCCLAAVEPGAEPGVVETATRIIDGEGATIAEATTRGAGLDATDYAIAYFEGRVSQFICASLLRTAMLRELGGFASPRNLRLDLRVLLLLGAEGGRIDLPEIKASYRRHEQRTTALSTAADWMADDLDIVETAVALAPPERRSEVREAGLGWAARWSYERACERLPFGPRVALIFRAWRRCGWRHRPWPGAFVGLHSPWGRGLRRLKARARNLAGR